MSVVGEPTGGGQSFLSHIREAWILWSSGPRYYLLKAKIVVADHMLLVQLEGSLCTPCLKESETDMNNKHTPDQTFSLKGLAQR
jgi:hypothetical protein